MTLLRWGCAIALACLSTAAGAQKYPLSASPDGWARPTAPCLYDSATKDCTPVGPTAPLPTTAAALAPSGVTALTGTSTGAQTVGPFVPVLGRPITLALAASSWPGGNVQLLRSTDGGVTKLPLTPAGVTIGTYSGPGADSPWIETESGATYYLSLPGSGITYRVAQ